MKTREIHALVDIDDLVKVNGKWVSTVFIGLDHRWLDDGKLEIFETMVFDEGKESTEDYCERYATWDEALEGHGRAVQWVKDGCKDESE